MTAATTTGNHPPWRNLIRFARKKGISIRNSKVAILGLSYKANIDDCRESPSFELIKILKTKSTKDISLLLFIMAFLGVILWLVYGFLINDVPVMVGNGISLLLVGSVLILKLKYDGN